MKTHYNRSSLISTILLSGCLFLTQTLFAQESGETPADSSKQVVETINLSDISLRSRDAIQQINGFAESLISDEALEALKLQNEVIIAEIDSVDKANKHVTLEEKNIRSLNNRLTFWSYQKGILETEMKVLEDNIQKFEDTKEKLNKEQKVWENTEKLYKQRGEPANVTRRIPVVLGRIDSVRGLVNIKRDYVFILLDRSAITSARLEEIDKLINETIIERESQVFKPDQPSVFSPAYYTFVTFRLAPAFELFYEMEWVDLVRYLKNHIPNIIFQILLLVVLIFAFTSLKTKIRNHDGDYTSRYKKILRRILMRPWSAAIIIGLLGSSIIFSNRPLIFKDIVIILVSIPIIQIVKSVISKPYHNFVNIFGLLIFLRLTYYVFPANHIVYALGIATIAIIEMIILGLLSRKVKHHKFKRKFYGKLVLAILIFHMGTAFIGLIAIILGMTLLADITINIPIANTFAFLLLIISALIIDGLAEVAIDSKSMQKINVFRNHGTLLKAKITSLLNFTATVLLVLIILRSLNLDRPFIEGFTSFFTTERVFFSTEFTIGSIVAFFFVIWLSIFLSRIIVAVLEEDVLNRFSLAKGVPRTISVMFRYTLITLGVVLAVRAAGMPMTNLTVIFGAFSIGIGFGLQNIFNNLVSGLILLFERPIQIGDTIEVGTLMGNVKSMGIRSSHVRTFDGAEIIVPNGNLISNEVVNWTLSDKRRRIEVIAGVAYGTDPHLVQNLFMDILKKHEDILQDPLPNVFFQAMGESSLDFRLLFWTAKFDEWVRIRSEITFSVHDVLVKNDIEIPFPQRDLHIRSIDQGLKVEKD